MLIANGKKREIIRSDSESYIPQNGGALLSCNAPPFNFVADRSCVLVCVVRFFGLLKAAVAGFYEWRLVWCKKRGC